MKTGLEVGVRELRDVTRNLSQPPRRGGGGPRDSFQHVDVAGEMMMLLLLLLLPGKRWWNVDQPYTHTNTHTYTCTGCAMAGVLVLRLRQLNRKRNYADFKEAEQNQ